MKINYTLPIYIVLTVILVLYPHFIDGHIISIQRTPLIDSIINSVIVLLGIVAYTVHKQQITNLERKQKETEISLQKSFYYNGIVNSGLDCIKDFKSQIQKTPTKRIEKQLLIEKVNLVIQRFGNIKMYHTTNKNFGYIQHHN